MVEIREESTGPLPEGGDSNASSSSQTSRPSTSTPRFASMMDYMKAKQTDSLLFLCRLVTIACAICYILPLGSFSASGYTRAFAAAAATNVFRLRQRLTWFAFSREFLQTMLLEDSAHYVMYCIIFITSAPVTMALVPITLFAVWHSAKFFCSMCKATGNTNMKLFQIVDQTAEKHTANLLGIIACAEIFIFPVFCAMIFMGKVSIFFPLIYGRFLTLRYMSQRNPYTRTAFSQLKGSLIEAVNRPACPQMLRTVAYKGIALVEHFAPATASA